MSNDVLHIWTIYDRPSDFPHNYVARKFALDKPTDDFIVSPNLDALRQIMVDKGLTCLTRSPQDDPRIVESWL
jgi:hypothetical protein